MTIDEKRPEVRRDAHITEPTDLKLIKYFWKKNLDGLVCYDNWHKLELIYDV